MVTRGRLTRVFEGDLMTDADGYQYLENERLVHEQIEPFKETCDTQPIGIGECVKEKGHLSPWHQAREGGEWI
jgi:hypothetical protein